MSITSALLISFYLYKDPAGAQALVARVRESQALEEIAPDVWYSETASSKTLLHCIVPPSPAAQDTHVVQLALSEAGAAAAVWPRLRQRGDAIVKEPGALSPNLLGYTLIYYAMCALDTDADAYCKDLLPSVKRLSNAVPDPPPAIIVHSPMADGHLYLLATPVGDGLAAATIYLALAPGDPTSASNPLMRRVLFGRAAALLMPDLIAHKSYAEQRAMQRDTEGGAWRAEYNQQVEALRSAVRALLQQHPGGQVALREADLEPLIYQYEALVGRSIRLDAFAISLAQQYHHYEWWQQEAGEHAVVRYHAEALRIAVKELDLLLNKGRSVLDVAGTTVEIARTQLEKQRIEAEKQAEQETERYRQVIGGLLAVISIALAIPQLVTWEVACGWLLRVGGVVHCENTLALRPFAVQLGCIVLAILVAVPLVLWLLKWVEPRRRG